MKESERLFCAERIKITWKGLFRFLYSLAFACLGLHKLVSGSWLPTEILGNLGNWNSTWEWSFAMTKVSRNLERTWFTTLRIPSDCLASTLVAINNRETIEDSERFEFNCIRLCLRRFFHFDFFPNLVSTNAKSFFQRSLSFADQSLWKRNLSKFDLFASEQRKEEEICRRNW